VSVSFLGGLLLQRPQSLSANRSHLIIAWSASAISQGDPEPDCQQRLASQNILSFKSAAWSRLTRASVSTFTVA